MSEQNRALEANEIDNIFGQTSGNSAKSEKLLQNAGVIAWTRVDHMPYFRAEWRLVPETTDLEFNFFHKEGPDPHKDHDKGLTVEDDRGNLVAKVEHGKPIMLPPSFEELLYALADILFKKKGYPYTIEVQPEVFAYRLTVEGASRNFMARDTYTTGLMDAVHANIPGRVPELVS